MKKFKFIRVAGLLIFAAVVLVMILSLSGCEADLTSGSSNRQESVYQEELVQQAADEVGMPDITEFYEKKLAKEIFELRDDSSLICYAYTKSDMTGKYVFLGRTMGYGLPYSTQYTNPQKYINDPNGSYDAGSIVIEQADPNGMYSPDGLSATWLWLIDEGTGEPNIAYVEQEIFVTQSKLPARICESWSLPESY